MSTDAPKTTTDLRRADDVRVGDVVHKQRNIWFTVAKIERSGVYVCLRDAANRDWKNARDETPLRVKATT